MVKWDANKYRLHMGILVERFQSLEILIIEYLLEFSGDDKYIFAKSIQGWRFDQLKKRLIKQIKLKVKQVSIVGQLDGENGYDARLSDISERRNEIIHSHYKLSDFPLRLRFHRKHKEGYLFTYQQPDIAELKQLNGDISVLVEDLWAYLQTCLINSKPLKHLTPRQRMLS
jgi:hypothetical protein